MTTYMSNNSNPNLLLTFEGPDIVAFTSSIYPPLPNDGNPIVPADWTAYIPSASNSSVPAPESPNAHGKYMAFLAHGYPDALARALSGYTGP